MYYILGFRLSYVYMGFSRFEKDFILIKCFFFIMLFLFFLINRKWLREIVLFVLIIELFVGGKRCWSGEILEMEEVLIKDVLDGGEWDK